MIPESGLDLAARRNVRASRFEKLNLSLDFRYSVFKLLSCFHSHQSLEENQVQPSPE